MPIQTTSYAYPFDPTGTAETNRINDEVHTITPVNYRDYFFIVPKLAPFFADGISIKLTDVEGNVLPFVEGQDYYFGHHFLAASRAIGKQVYGSISIIKKDRSGILRISYQTIGGQWTYDQDYLNQIMTNIVSNPRISTWDSIVVLPGLFPVINHEWNLIDLVGMKEVIQSLYGIQSALVSGEGGGGDILAAHLANYSNPHAVKKEQIGLGNVEDFATSTEEEATQGNLNTRYMTPLRVRQAIQALVLNAFNDHIQNTNNPHQVTPEDIGSYSKDQIDAYLSDKLDKSGKAHDSSLLDGKTLDEIIAGLTLNSTVGNSERLSGLTLEDLVNLLINTDINNALKLSGKTLDEIKTDFEASTVKNAKEFDGLTLEAFYEHVADQAELCYQQAFVPRDLIDTTTDVWSELVFFDFTPGTTKAINAELIVSGTTVKKPGVSASQMVRLSVIQNENNPFLTDVNFIVDNVGNTPSDTLFFYKKESANGIDRYRVFAKTKGILSPIHVTVHTRSPILLPNKDQADKYGDGKFINNNVYLVEPVGLIQALVNNDFNQLTEFVADDADNLSALVSMLSNVFKDIVI